MASPGESINALRGTPNKLPLNPTSFENEVVSFMEDMVETNEVSGHSSMGVNRGWSKKVGVFL